MTDAQRLIRCREANSCTTRCDKRIRIPLLSGLSKAKEVAMTNANWHAESEAQAAGTKLFSARNRTLMNVRVVVIQ